jgi:hypothetical protein
MTGRGRDVALMTSLCVLLLQGCVSAATRPSAGSDNLVVSRAWPDLTLRIAASFRRLPAITFPIENLTDATRHVFVEAGPDAVIQRMVIVQLETVQRGSDFRFVFPSTPPQKFGNETYRWGTFVYDDAKAASEKPDREPGQTRRLLTAHGLKPPRVLRVARLARVAHPDGLSEVIIFYMENADADFPSLRDPDGVSVEPDESERLFRTLSGAIEVIRG